MVDDSYKDELIEILGKTKNERGFDFHKFRVLYKTKYINKEIQRDMNSNREKEQLKKKEIQRLERLKQLEEKLKAKKSSYNI